MKKSCSILCIAAVFIFTSCSSKINIPSQNKLISTMEDAGYTVNKTSVISDIADLSRIVATKGDIGQLIGIVFSAIYQKKVKVNVTYSH